LLMEQLDYNFLFRWFVGLSLDERVWDATVFSKNRDRRHRKAKANFIMAAIVLALAMVIFTLSMLRPR